jgi:hypothetical protein
MEHAVVGFLSGLVLFLVAVGIGALRMYTASTVEIARLNRLLAAQQASQLANLNHNRGLGRLSCNR